MGADGWAIEPIFDAAATQRSLAVDSLGRPHLALNARWKSGNAADPATYTRLWYAHLENGAWQQQTVNNSAGYLPVIAVDATNRVHITYFYYSPNSSFGGELTYWLDGKSTVLVEHLYELDALAMAVDSHGTPHISQLSNSRLFYRTFDGANWQYSVAPDPEIQRFSTSIALGPDDQPYILYEERDASETHTLYLARPGAPWQVEAVTQGSNAVLAFDSAGLPHLVYEAGGQLRHAWRTAAGWQSQSIAPLEFGSGPTGFAIAPDGRLLVAYIDVASNDLLLAELPAPAPAGSRLFLPLIVR
jgi:hypothetical protein